MVDIIPNGMQLERKQLKSAEGFPAPVMLGMYIFESMPQ